MKNLLLFFFLIIIVSCNKQAKNTIIKNPKVKKEVKTIDSIKVFEKRNSNQPIKEFQQFVENLEKDNWFSDTLRLKKVDIYSSLKNENVSLFNKRPFYKIDFKNTEVKHMFDARIYDGKYADSLNIKVVEKVKTIWGYFYRGKKIENTIEDGVIEQWEYESNELAEKAFIEMDDFSYIAYFNTSPYMYRLDNCIFIFHTRSMGFSYGQKKIFKKFKDLILNN